MTKRRTLLFSFFLLFAVLGLGAGHLADRSLVNQQARAKAEIDSTGYMAYGDSSASASIEGLASDLGPVTLVWRVLQIIKTQYVDAVDPFSNSKMSENAVKTMVQSLGDVNSRFLDADQVRLIRDASMGRFEGIGAVLKIKEDKKEGWTDQNLKVVAPLPGSPAEKAGLLPGDIIEEIDEKWVMRHDPLMEALAVFRDFSRSPAEKRQAEKEAREKRDRSISLDEAWSQLMTSSEKPLSLKVLRDDKSVSVSISTQRLTADAVESRILEPGVGYLRVGMFTPASANSFIGAMRRLTDQGAKSVVLDLRNSPGGSAAAVESVAAYLMPGKKLATVERANGRTETLTTSSEKPAEVPGLVVLVNEGTEGVSELLAASLRDNLKVRLIGQVTWGNALERTAFRLENGSGYTLSTGKYLPPSGTDFHNRGVRPDAIVPMSPTRIATPEDSQLNRAVTVAKRPAA